VARLTTLRSLASLPFPPPASSYFSGVVDETADGKVSRLTVVQGPGPFARAVADGATVRASEHGIDCQVVEASLVEAEEVGGKGSLGCRCL
jgi:hypothetical protein